MFADVNICFISGLEQITCFDFCRFCVKFNAMEEMGLKNYAYIGDAVWELKIRNKTIHMTNNPRNLHKLTTEKVKAEYQAVCLSKLEDWLTDEEKEISRRGRNLPIPVGRRANQQEYRLATAFETLIGHWYLHNPHRLEEIYAILEI